MTHVLQVGGDGDRVVLKQVIRLREKTGSGGAEDGRKQNYGDAEAEKEGDSEPKGTETHTQRGQMKRARYRDPQRGGQWARGWRTGTQREGDSEPEKERDSELRGTETHREGTNEESRGQ